MLGMLPKLSLVVLIVDLHGLQLLEDKLSLISRGVNGLPKLVILLLELE